MSKQTQSLHICEYCHKEFKLSQNLNKHIRVLHQKEPKLKNFGKYCPSTGCKFVCGKRKDLWAHVEEIHDVPLTHEVLTFGTINEFKSWKFSEEKSSKSSFILEKTAHNSTETLYSYKCYREGTYNSKAQRRLPRAQGSCKMGATCTAFVKVNVPKTSNKITVEYCSTHFGHSFDLDFLRISKHDKLDIANQLRSGVSFEEILDNIRDTGQARLEAVHDRSDEDANDSPVQSEIGGIPRNAPDVHKKHYILGEYLKSYMYTSDEEKAVEKHLDAAITILMNSNQ